ncbi:lasso peptide biosynthesis B2 protein [Sphingomonas sp. BGYR3]|uniref:lasso peptide biosynthesis B2 protein n=1 Tax=Sphingomonas sp. BGYR3 TaxID=2975483 RepID=UPI0021A342E1|nr:lasso peptide biosynthesis B2 protein [Sphingomonas sp. BGYR3]MDG5488847.1 lasso peptide biosynthesis B2 protein [Sphingomonas sp. BGYR3]
MVPAAACPVMAHYWRLSEHGTVALSAGRAVFLNVAADRYAMLPPPLNAPFIAWLNDPARPLDADCRDSLCRLLGLDHDAAILPEPVPVTIPLQLETGCLPSVASGLGTALAAARTVRRAERMLKTRPFADNLARRRALLAMGRDADPVAILARAGRFWSVRHLAPVRRVCLLDSLALLDWLAPRLGGVELVFGVTALPFGAHCWVQTRDALLGDAPDTIGRYAPILHLSA